MTYLFCQTCSQSNVLFLKISAFSSSVWITMWFGHEFIIRSLDRRVDWIKQPLKRLALGLIAMVVYTVAMIRLLIEVFEYTLNMYFGDIDDTIYSSMWITFTVTLIMTSRSFHLKWRQAAIDAERLKREGVAAKYESLKNQVNPHFLFNSFNVLSNLVYEDQEKAVKFIKQLSEVYRYVLETRDKEMVSLEDELKFLRSYVYLQQIRFGDKLRIDVFSGIPNAAVAPLALQMLVENAIKHNVVSEEDPLKVEVFAEDGYILVRNNLQKKAFVGDSQVKVGLDNIRRRYEFLSEKKVEVVEDEQYFTVKLPVLLNTDI